MNRVEPNTIYITDIVMFVPQVPELIVEDFSERLGYQEVPDVISDLCNYSVDPNFDTSSCLGTLKVCNSCSAHSN